MRILHLESTISFYTFILELESFEYGYPPKKIADKGKIILKKCFSLCKKYHCRTYGGGLLEINDEAEDQWLYFHFKIRGNVKFLSFKR